MKKTSVTAERAADSSLSWEEVCRRIELRLHTAAREIKLVFWFRDNGFNNKRTMAGSGVSNKEKQRRRNMYFSTIAIIPGDTFKNEYYVKEAVNDLLVPYWKHLEASYDRQHCRCIGSLSMKDSDGYLKGFFKLEEVRGRIKDFGIEPEVRPNNIPVLEFMAKRRLAYFNEYSPYRYQPDPECPICGGTGYDIKYYNPDTKWDAYVIGGRFDGKIWGPERFEEHQEVRIGARKDKIRSSLGNDGNTTEDFLPHFKDCDIDDNCRLVSDIPIEKSVYAPYALVTPDGKWHEEGDFTKAVFYTESVNEQWHELLKAEFAKYPTHLAVLLDCQRS